MTRYENLRNLRQQLNYVVNGKTDLKYPTIFISNHNCLKDIFYVPMALSSPGVSLISSRLIYKPDNNRKEMVEKYLYSMPIEAHGGTEYSDLCLKYALDLLKDSINLSIFHEGAYINDNKHVYKGRTGIARILYSALDLGLIVNLIPVSIEIYSENSDLDDYNLNNTDQIKVKILDPIDYQKYYHAYHNSRTREERNYNLHGVIDEGMKKIAIALNRTYVDSYIYLNPKGNVMFSNGKKVDLKDAHTKEYYHLYEQELQQRAKQLKKQLIHEI